MSRKALLPALATLFVLTSASSAWAHPQGAGGNFSAGFTHPFLGLDHLLAMVAVGLLAVRVGGKGLWMMPLAFLGSMLLGGLLASAGVAVPGVEFGILASVLVLGLLVALAQVLPWAAAGALVGLFAMFHGHAHAEEMLAEGSFALYAVGFLLATAILHLSGIAAGLAITRWISVPALRFCGGAIAAASLLLMIP